MGKLDAVVQADAPLSLTQEDSYIDPRSVTSAALLLVGVLFVADLFVRAGIVVWLLGVH